MMSNNFSETVGYVLFVVGLGLTWYSFGWLIALTVGVLMYGFLLMIGAYILILVNGIHQKIDEASMNKK